MDESVGGADEVLISGGVEGVSGDDFTFVGEVALRGGADQAADAVAALDQGRNQTTADIAGASSNEHAPRMLALGELLDLQEKADVRDGGGHVLTYAPGWFWDAPARVEV